MTLTKKVGTLLLLLTAGSLIGAAVLAFFFRSTASDGLFLVSSNLKQNIIQQLLIHVLMVREGDASAREPLSAMIEDFDGLTQAMELGGVSTRAGNAPGVLALWNRVNSIGMNVDLSVDDSTRQIVALLRDGLPVPPPDLHAEHRTLREVWGSVAGAFRTVADRPVEDPETHAAYAHIREMSVAFNDASRRTTVAVGRRISLQRERVMTTLAGLSGLSFLLLGAGLWFTKRYVAEPIRVIEKATARVKDGDFSYRIPITSNDELASLARTFNEMSAEIKRLVDRYHELFDNAADCVYTADLNRNILSVNKATERFCGYTREELLTMKVDQMIDPEHQDLLGRMQQQKMVGGQPSTTYELKCVRKDGARVFMEASTRLIFENGRPVAIQGVGRDITERKKLQEQLWMAQKMDAVGRMASGIAHDFGNVLTIITGYASLMLATLKPGDPMRKEVEGIQKAAHRAATLIRHLLGFSSGQVFRPRIIRIEAVLAEMTDMLSRLIGEDIQIVTAIEPGVGRLRMDPGQFEQVIVNLALNARDALPGVGVLRISATNADHEKPFVRIEVSDNGSGMSPEVMDRIFEPFYSTKEHGTGLGLSTVQTIILQNGGSISVKSAPKQGTRFSMLLPRAQEEVRDIEEATPVVKRGSETILLVEDDPEVRRLVREMLQVQGYNVVEAEDQQHAIELCRRKNIHLDLLLTDVVMPIMSGPEMAERIEPLRPEMPVIFLSGHTRDRFADTGIEPENVHFIQKPVTPEILSAKIREVLDSR